MAMGLNMLAFGEARKEMLDTLVLEIDCEPLDIGLWDSNSGHL